MFEELLAINKLTNDLSQDSCPLSGKISILGWEIHYKDKYALASSIDQLLIGRINDFNCHKEDPVIIDCGSNIGLSILNYKKKYPKSKITAFEPDPEFLPYLTQNISANSLEDVELIEAAVWTKNSTVDWFCEGINGSKIIQSSATKERTIKVKTIDLRDFLSRRIDLLKIDIEGEEYSVIDHIRDVLDNVENLIVECHIDQDNITQFSETIRLLKEQGYSVLFNTIGGWRDLIRYPKVAPNQWEQHAIISAYRNPITSEGDNDIQLPTQGYELLEYKRSCSASLSKLLSSSLKKGNKIKTYELARPFSHDEGHAFYQKLPSHINQGDSSERNDSSIFVLFEDGKALGPPHALHESIRKSGYGQFSHWHNSIIFSSSDGTNPNLNERKYELIYI